MTTLSLGWFSTGRGPGSRALLTAAMDSIGSGELEAKIAYVFCNREPGEHEGTDQFMHLVRGYGLPLVYYSSRNFRRGLRGDPDWRIKYDREVMERLKGYPVDLCMLAGYMLIVGAEMCHHYNMLNLHPALPGGPVGTWQEVIWKLIQARAAETGAMIHLATEELDRGPAIAYFSFPIRGEPFDALWKQAEGRSIEEMQAKEGEELPLFKLIRERGLARELPLVIATLKAFSQDRMRIERGQVLDASGNPIHGLFLNKEIEARLKSA